ncbi:MAG: prephenate dehydrogenase [Gemmatimonadota bacterium]|nr:prephenate dehydrogenase [Gemmatimonadota bacterium]MDH4349388.1 prephenate dehydrogenase [Gemmatimonadota bacterium]MDH5283878.1 prephenate dehydrogenase [Gemmatimonadota bacterium]
MRPDSLAVLGLGAMGGSVAWQARRAGVSRVIGYSRSRPDAVQALRSGALDDLADSPATAVAGADLVVVATPPSAIRELLALVASAAPSRALVTDIASVKSPVMHWAREAGLDDRFAGSHPFAGTHVEGWAGATPNLFRGAVVYVVSAGASGDSAAREVMDFWRAVMEAEPVLINGDTHDTQLAWTSHLPQAVASALARAVGLEGRLRSVTWGRGICDSTRIAASPPEAWVDILLLNREAVLPAMQAFESQIAECREILTSGDRERLRAWLEQAAAIRRGVTGPGERL